MRYFLFLLASFILSPTLQAGDFSYHVLDSEAPGPTILVVGGIQGDEPGGFHAAALLATKYKVTAGKVLIVPNLNFKSILAVNRGGFGDMNRKFAEISEKDPDYAAVAFIKATILREDVSYVFNLHDGSGFYRPEATGNWALDPKRWGQSIVIDDTEVALKNGGVGSLLNLATRVTQRVNGSLLKAPHAIRVKNTNTAAGDLEMAKSLSYYAFTNGKQAVGLEASKDLPLEERAYYHLLMLESYMLELGLAFDRSFDLSAAGVATAMWEELSISFMDGRVSLNLGQNNGQMNLAVLPLSVNKKGEVKYITSNPLIALVKQKNGRAYSVHYGNTRLTSITSFSTSPAASVTETAPILISVDGKQKEAWLGSTVRVTNSFEIAPVSGYRFNVIGKVGTTDEGTPIFVKDLQKKWAINKQDTYRVEMYRGTMLSGTFLVTVGPREREVMPSPAMAPLRLERVAQVM